MKIVVETATYIDPLTKHYRANDLVDVDRTGLLGISMGGAVIYQYLPGRKPSIKAAVSMVAGIASFWCKVLKNLQTWYPAFVVTDELVASSKPIESMLFLEGVRDFPLLMQYGEADPLVPVEDVRALHGQVRQNYADQEKITLLTYPGVGHETPAGMYARALEWFKKYL
jgi:dienelactone hydrolase